MSHISEDLFTTLYQNPFADLVFDQKIVSITKCLQKIPCISWCSYGIKSVELRPMHMPLFDLENGVQLKVANVGKAIIGSVDNKITVFDTIPLALDIENYCSVNYKQYVARISLVDMGFDPKQKNNNYNTVFHTILNMGNIKPKLNLPPKTIHIEVYEHTNDRKSVSIEEALKLLTQYLENHLIVWKNFNCDFRAPLNVGLVFVEKTENLCFIEIERFYRRLGRQSFGSSYSLDWLQKYVLLRPNIQNIKHPVDDACHHLTISKGPSNSMQRAHN